MHSPFITIFSYIPPLPNSVHQNEASHLDKMSLTTLNRYDSRWRQCVRYLNSTVDVDTPAGAGRRPALSREEVPVGVALGAERSDGVWALLLIELAQAALFRYGAGGVEREGLTQGQKDTYYCETHTEHFHGGGDDDEAVEITWANESKTLIPLNSISVNVFELLTSHRLSIFINYTLSQLGDSCTIINSSVLYANCTELQLERIWSLVFQRRFHLSFFFPAP